jgi:hypothetical protein
MCIRNSATSRIIIDGAIAQEAEILALYKSQQQWRRVKISQ